MATKQETTLQQNIAKAIKRRFGKRAWVMKVHGGPYQKAGVPDLLVIIDGRAYWLEVKMPGETPEPIQVAVMRELVDVGCRVAVVTSVDSALSALIGWPLAG